MQTGVTSPSLSNNATEYKIGGTTPYGDVLFTVGVVGQNSTLNKDDDHTLLPTLHHFVYDADVYVTNVSITQALEFDLSLWMSGVTGMTFGTECNHLGDKSWDVWNNVSGHWVSAGVPCKLVTGWNHVTIHFQRTSDNSLIYESITLDGTTYPLNIASPSISSPNGWWGLAANYQIDGNQTLASNTTYLDNLSVTYW